MSGEKTEEATPKQLEKARERGEVSQSRDLTGSVLLAAAAAVISGRIDDVAHTFTRIATTVFNAAGSPISNDVMLTQFGDAVLDGAKTLVPLLGVLFMLSLAMGFLQVGPLLSFSPLAPKFSKLNPINGFKRMFFSLNPYIELLKSTLKVVVVGVIFYLAIKASLRDLLYLSQNSPEVAAKITTGVAGTALTRAAVFFIFIGALDFMYQKWQYKKGLRMSKEEIKQEYKESEGDPHAKAHRKQVQQELSQESMVQHARKANAMVTNPEHLACALRYDPNEENAPRLLAKGKGYMAARLREIAKEEDIPIVRDVSLAHALFALELETEVPEELFDAVAEVLKWVELVMKSEGRTPLWMQPRDEGEEA